MSGINYKTEFFPHETLTKIQGQPDYATLTLLKKELQANAQSVPTTLGGGAHGYLGLVLSNVEYAQISAVPLVIQPHPGALTFPARTSSVEAKLLEVTYKQDLLLYTQCDSLKKTLIQQIIKAVDAEWLIPLQHERTHAIEVSVQDVLTFLFQEHGYVTPTALAKQEEEVKKIYYNPSTDPVDNVFTAVQKLSDLATAANAAYTVIQKINLAYCILKQQRVFKTPIKEWNRHVKNDPTNLTWMEFKRFFREQYKELKEVGELRADDTEFNQAHLVNEIVAALRHELPPHQAVSPILPVPPAPPTPLAPVVYQDFNQQVPQTLPSVNAARFQNQNPSDAISALLQQLQLQNNIIQQCIPVQRSTPNNNNNYNVNNGRNTGRGRNNGGRGRGRNTRGNGRGFGGRRQRRQMKYCHTHGWTNHSGDECFYPSEAHQAEATLENRMGGSMDGLPPGYV